MRAIPHSSHLRINWEAMKREDLSCQEHDHSVSSILSGLVIRVPSCILQFVHCDIEAEVEFVVIHLAIICTGSRRSALFRHFLRSLVLSATALA